MKDQEALIDRYLEGLCTEEEKAQIEAHTKSNADFEAYIKKQQRLHQLALIAIQLEVERQKAEPNEEKQKYLAQAEKYKKFALEREGELVADNQNRGPKIDLSSLQEEEQPEDEKKNILKFLQPIALPLAACFTLLILVQTGILFPEKPLETPEYHMAQNIPYQPKFLKAGDERDERAPNDTVPTITLTDSSALHFQTLIKQQKENEAKQYFKGLFPQSTSGKFHLYAAMSLLALGESTQALAKLEQAERKMGIDDQIDWYYILAYLQLDDLAEVNKRVCDFLKAHGNRENNHRDESYNIDKVDHIKQYHDFSCK